MRGKSVQVFCFAFISSWILPPFRTATLCSRSFVQLRFRIILKEERKEKICLGTGKARGFCILHTEVFSFQKLSFSGSWQSQAALRLAVESLALGRGFLTEREEEEKVSPWERCSAGTSLGRLWGLHLRTYSELDLDEQPDLTFMLWAGGWTRDLCPLRPFCDVTSSMLNTVGVMCISTLFFFFFETKEKEMYVTRSFPGKDGNKEQESNNKWMLFSSVM